MAEDQWREALSLDVSKFIAGLKQAEQGLKDFQSRANASVSGVSSGFQALSAGLAKVGAALAAAAGTAAMGLMVKSAGEAAEELQQLEIQTGISADKLQDWSVAMRRVGLDTGDLAQMMRLLSQNIVEARDQSTNAARMFNVLGVSRETLATADTNLILREMASRFSELENGADKSRIAIELLGRGGLQALPLFNSDLKAAAEESKRFGKLSEDQIAQLARMDDAFDDLGTAIKKAKDLLGAELAPAMEESLHAMTDMVVMLKDMFLGPDSIVGAMAKGVGVLFVSFVGVVKEAIAYVKLSREEYLKELEKIDKETRDRIDRIMNPKGADEKKPGKKVTAPEDPAKAREEAVKLLEAEYKMRQAQEALGEQRLSDMVAHEKAGLERQVALREVYGAEIVEMTANIGLREVEGKLKLMRQMQEIDQQYHDSRVKIGFKDEAEANAFEMDFATIKLNREKQVASLESKLDTDRYAKRTAVIKAIDKEEEDSGKHKVENAVSTYNVTRNLSLRELQDRVALKQAEVDVADAEFATFEESAKRRYELMEAQMALELAQHENNEAEKAAITRKYEALMAREERRIHDGFLQGILEGLHQYTTNMNSMFGLTVDMARSAAQQMQQLFKTIFMDFFEGKIRSMKDLMKSFGDFVKQIMADVLAKLATVAAFNAVTGLFPGLGSAGTVMSGIGASSGLLANQGGKIQRFTMGGPVFSNGDSVPAMLTPGEFVVSRKGVDALNRLNQGQVGPSHEGDITVNVVNSEKRERPEVQMRRSMEGMVIDIIWKNVRENGSLRGLFQGGAA